MALTVRSPIEDLLTSFTSVEQSQIASTAVGQYRKLEQDNFELFNYAMSPKATDKLYKAGIYLSPYSAMAHSHPVCKTLENYFLYKVLPSYVNNDFYFVGVKKNKFEFLKKREKKLQMVDLVNRYVTSLDKLRYGSEFCTLPMFANTVNGRRQGGFESATLIDLVPRAIKNRNRPLFIHDELHYWKKKDLFSFLNAVKPKVILGTIVYPPELLAGSKESLNKWCYEYEISGKDLIFHPDGVRAECYVQPLSGGFLLKTKKIVLPDGTVYCVDLLHSKFAHHLVAITLGDAEVVNKRFFGNFEAISCKSLKPLCSNVTSTIPIHPSLISKLYCYLRTLLKPDLQSAMAKLRQLTVEPTGFEIKFTQELSSLIIECKSENMFVCPSFFRKLRNRLVGYLPSLLSRLDKAYRISCLDDFIASLCEFSFHVDLEIQWEDFDIEMALYDFIDPQEIDLDPETMENKFWGKEQHDVSLEHKSLKAQLAKDTIGKPYVLECNEKKFRGLIRSALFNSGFSASNCSEFPRSFIDSFISALLSRHPLAAIFKHLCRGTELNGLKRYLDRHQKEFNLFFYQAFSKGSLIWFTCPILRRGYTKFLEYGLDSGTKACYANVCSDITNWAKCALRRNRDFAYTEGYLGFNTKGVSCFTKPSIESWASCHVDITSVNKQIKQVWVEPMVQEVEESFPAAGVAVEATATKRCITMNDVPNHQPSVITKDDVLRLEAPSQSVAEIITPDKLKCSCGTDICPKSFEYDFPELKFPETSSSRSICWFSAITIDYSYGGCAHKSMGWPEWLDDFLLVLGEGSEGYNCCLVQKFKSGASIDYHSNDEAIFDETTPVLALNKGGSCIFSVRSKERHTKGNNYLCFGATVIAGDCKFTMPQGFQLSHKYAISDCSEGLISLTFRRLRKNSPEATFSKPCKTRLGDSEVAYSEAPYQGIDTFKVVDVPGDGYCFWHSVGFFLGVDGVELKQINEKRLGMEERSGRIVSLELKRQLVGETYAEIESVIEFSNFYCMDLKLHCPGLQRVISIGQFDQSRPTINLSLVGQHYSPLVPKNDCVVSSVAAALTRPIKEIYKVLCRSEHAEILNELNECNGLSMSFLEEVFRIFDIKAVVNWDGEPCIFNEAGTLNRVFAIDDDHLTFSGVSATGDMRLARTSELERYSPAAIAILERSGTRLVYRPSQERAELLTLSLLRGDTGTISDKLFANAADLSTMMKNKGLEEFQLHAILGTFGAGKSYLFKEFLKKSMGKFVTLVSPRKGLADDFKSFASEICSVGRKVATAGKLSGGMDKKWSVYTFEVFLKKMQVVREGQVLIIDEVQLFPPCYLDLVLLCIPATVKVFVVGDPCQSDYDNERDRMHFDGVQRDVDKLLENSNYKFNTLSKRFRNANFSGRLPCNIDESRTVMHEPYVISDSFEDVNELPKHMRAVFLVSSFDEKRIVRAHYGNTVCCLTFGESTGRTFDYGVILVTSSSTLTSEKRWITALSRFRDNLCLLNLLGIPPEQLDRPFTGRALERFLTGTALVSDLLQILPGKPTLVRGFTSPIGKDSGVREFKLAGDPWLKGLVDLMQVEDQEMVAHSAFIEQEWWFKTHLPRSNMESVRAEWVHRIKAKEDREVWIKQMRTEQFCEEHSRSRGAILTNAAERFESIYPRHRASDSATFFMAVKKRMRFSKPAVEMAKLNDASAYGEFLLKYFLRFVPLTERHELDLMEQARQEFFDKKVSKSAATIENHSGRSCRDWLADIAFLFSKSQICTKFEKRFADAKAAQSVVCFQHEVLCRFAPYMRYIEKKVNKVLPDNFYIHSGKGLEELNSWVKRGNFTGVCTESDYEAFDASQDHYIMAFEIALMRFLRLPNDLIEDYRYIKTHLGSKLGNFAIMRFSGEASTFLFNTLANMLFTFLRYDVTGKEYICFAGDDMCSSKRLRSWDENESFLSKLRLKAKVQYTTKPTFCGWNLNSFGIFKKPQLVYERMCIAKETDNLRNCIDNYAIEVAFAYRLGEEATNVMDEEELASHYMCVRVIIQNKHLIKSDVLKYFEVGDKA